jgi:hypothetical protein
MSSYGQIAYEDMALLNAQWQQARPPMAGLGAAVYGQHEYRDVSLLNARLRSIMPAQVGLSPDGLGAGSISGNSIGASITLPEVTIVADPGGSGGYSAGSTNWLLYGGAFAALAIGSALIYRASKKR